jgi:hypothetical protein
MVNPQQKMSGLFSPPDVKTSGSEKPKKSSEEDSFDAAFLVLLVDLSFREPDT